MSSLPRRKGRGGAGPDARAGFEPIEFRISYKAELYPVIALAAARSKTIAPAADQLAVLQTKTFLNELVARDDTLWRHTAERVDRLDGPVYVWGAGVHTAQLFDRTISSAMPR